MFAWFVHVSWDPGHRTKWMDTVLTLASLASLAGAAVGTLLQWSIRCAVCGLRLTSSSAARLAGSQKWAWLAALEECPVCFDDGSAEASGATQWKSKGAIQEEPYWTARRLLFATLLALAVVGGGVYLGASYRLTPATWADQGSRK